MPVQQPVQQLKQAARLCVLTELPAIRITGQHHSIWVLAVASTSCCGFTSRCSPHHIATMASWESSLCSGAPGTWDPCSLRTGWSPKQLIGRSALPSPVGSQQRAAHNRLFLGPFLQIPLRARAQCALSTDNNILLTFPGALDSTLVMA